jgi:hypothetical protein
MPHWVKNELTKLGGTAQEQIREWIVKALFLSPLGFLYGFRDYFLRLIESILTKPIKLWHTPEILFALCYMITVGSFTFLLGKRTKITLDKPITTEPIQSNNKKVTFATKFDPPETIYQEGFQTFDGVTFKFRLSDGVLAHGYFCSKDHVPMIAKDSKPLTRERNIYVYKCPMCPEILEIEENTLNDIRMRFQLIVQSYIKGHLKRLPTRTAQ